MTTTVEQIIKDIKYREKPWRVAMKSEIMDLITLVTQVCNQEHISYSIINGTLLGSLKIRDMLPHEDDSDILIFYQDLPRFLTHLRTILPNTPFQLIPSFYGYILYGPKKGMLDLIIYDRDKKTNTYRACFPLSNGIPTFWMANIRSFEFKPEELFPLKLYPFGKLQLLGPNNPVNICKKMYGTDVFEVNRRPDHGFGIHPVWPHITKFINPITQSVVDFLGEKFPRLFQRN